MEQAFWVQSPGSGQLREERLPAPGPDDVLVRTLYSGVSRGTETLVFRGGVPASQHAVMRAPFQEGEFPGPVKYGYLNVGVVEQGPAHLDGKTVFCLYPHQTAYVVPASAVTPVPAAVPPGRAILAGTVETAVNAVWDARPRLGDRIAVIGAGMVGCSVAKLLTGFPAARVQLIDVDPAKADIAAALGVEFSTPDEALGDCDLVVHASASEAGLTKALELLAPEGEVVELSWYGDRRVSVPLGENFHSRRLVIRSSQVGTVARPDRSYAQRLAVALDLLADPAFEALVSGECMFKDLPSVLPRLVANELSALCLRVMYQPQ
ncbi:threonine dehydrogenase and related Zn-dependent dehydrogenase [Amycolatopsis mediterranei S699]|uniref:Threonine dehydrogenase and related Zn-dependent dehydrogenase n=2 Tax=Amycolatopsis mediterranei TaxID=33910 RepID=A0A0H3DIT1_AMYMU|nr:zinc-binding alcohol dehydrogenase [Amycolatopsis mediterranei]ADJ50048.1 threonine dehydrogenase and related Zn-dependent dehydrogenase [Amycolatopsis mediterranei U32]AEK47045.1 threonine dehydrogenase and related Zn-dependent dehydrogenase [Amycolatopsis mediterranei S699]AFO81756.1 threonine dehydrogenase and related Zn-dependent dehydrogenase [Amycolatopsis mediterranei S699]AGT88885.1 threonine dehydrogenase-related Zn-dependent dehydrogenase [Amycolatopsis mediterranei RB]KDO07703.1 